MRAIIPPVLSAYISTLGTRTTTLSRELKVRFHNKWRSNPLYEKIWPLRRRVGPVLKTFSLQRSIARLDESAEVLEQKFITIGQNLEVLTADSQKLISQSETMLRYVIGQHNGQNTLENAVAIFSEPMQFIDEFLARSNQLVVRLKHHEKQVQTIRELESVLQKTVSPLKFIQRLFRIESASLPVEEQSIFLGLTKDIEELQTKIGDIFNEHFRTLARSHETILAFIAKLETHILEQEKANQQKRRLIEDSLLKLREEISANQGRDVRLTQASQVISEQVGRIVVAMQFQDITRQKVQHIKAALSEMKSRGNAIVSPDAATRTPSDKVPHEVQFIRESSLLQASHLESVMEYLEHAQTEMRTGFQSLREAVKALDDECLNLTHFDSVTTSEFGMVQVTLNLLGEMRELVESTVRMQEDIYQTISPLGGQASNLTSVMRQLSINIKLIAVNAQVQAAHIGAGTGLEVLAESTSQISDEIFSFNESTAADLDAFVWGLDNIISECSAVCERGVAQQQFLATEGAKVEAEVHAYRDATLEIFLEVGASTQKIAEDSERALASVDFTRAISRPVEKLTRTLSALSLACGELDPAPAQPTGAATQHLHDRYTMACERDTHVATIHGGDTPPLPALAPDANVDFFDENFVAPAPVEPSPAPSPEPAPIADHRPTEASAAPITARPKKAADKLDDNIELF